MPCNCNAGFISEMTKPGSIHYAKKTCRQCGAFLGWLPKPKNQGKASISKAPFSVTQETCERLGRLGIQLYDSTGQPAPLESILNDLADIIEEEFSDAKQKGIKPGF